VGPRGFEPRIFAV